ncbi:MAG: rod shape-determining protein RodA [Gammaproteobacteria bacterium]|nr:rod shape-determining protein RodA [Gammaproteobacteria bacterium]
MKYFFILFFSVSLHGIELTPSPINASVYFISPNNEESINGIVTVKFGLKNFGVAPAGIQIQDTGHHHLIIDADLPPFNMPIPADKNHVHFGKGQTEVEIKLSEGEHTMQLLLGDFRHVPHDPPIYSKKIKIYID